MAIIPVMEVDIIRLTVAGAVALGGAMSFRRGTVEVLLDEFEPHGQSELRIWCWTWRGERAERPWTVAPGRWSPIVISPALGSAALSGRVVIH